MRTLRSWFPAAWAPILVVGLCTLTGWLVFIRDLSTPVIGD